MQKRPGSIEQLCLLRLWGEDPQGLSLWQAGWGLACFSPCVGWAPILHCQPLVPFPPSSPSPHHSRPSLTVTFSEKPFPGSVLFPKGTNGRAPCVAFWLSPSCWLSIYKTSLQSPSLTASLLLQTGEPGWEALLLSPRSLWAEGTVVVQ